MKNNNSGKIRLIFVTLLVLFILSVFSMSASAITYEGVVYSVYNDKCVVTGCEDGINGDVKIYDYVDGKTVVSIGEEAFKNQLAVSSVELPDTITSIGDSAFYGCSNLLSFDMPESVVNLGKSVFQKCRNLRTVKFSSNVLSVPESTFNGCTSLNSVNFSDDTSVFAGKSFFGCSSLEKFVFPEKTEYISDNAFNGCSSLKSLYVPYGIIYVGNYAFVNCDALSVVYFSGDYEIADSMNISAGNECFLKSQWKYDHNHGDIESSVLVEPSCSEYGYTEISCKCGYSEKISVVEPLGHKLDKFITIVQPDCKNKGKANWYCSKCDYFEVLSLDVTPHSSIIDEAVPADCYSDGRTEGAHCHACGEILKKPEVINALGHDFSKKIKTKVYLASPATYTKPAKFYYSCSRCNAMSKKTFDGDKNKLGKPSAITSSSTSSSITLSWNRVIDADYYAVYYKNSKGKWKLHKKVTNENIKIKNLEPGTIMTYAVRAYLTENDKTVKAPEYVTITEATKPLKPSKIEAKQNSSVIKLTWPASKGATGYRVYIYSTKSSKWKVMTSSTTKCTVTKGDRKSGTVYKFAVKPYIKVGSKTVWSEDYTTITTSTKPLPPVLKATSLKGGARLEWGKIRGADGYMIYGSKKPNSGFTKLKTTKSLTFTKTGLTSGENYYFKAYAVKKLNGEYIYSKISDVKVVRIK